MNDPELLRALEPVLDLLTRLGVRHFVGGSVASSAHGVSRASIDADVVAELSSSHVEPLISSLRDAYYVPEARVLEAVARRGTFNLIHLGTMLKVDVFVSRDRPHDRRALERVCLTSTGSEGRSIPVASAEDIVLAKLEWFRKGDEVSERQWGDVLGVLQAAATAVDETYLRRGAAELGVLDLLERALSEAARRG